MKEFFQYKTKNNPIPAIVIGCHKIGLGIIRSLGIKGVPVIALSYNPNDMGQVSKYVKAHFTVVNPMQMENKFVEQLQNISHNFPGAVLFPSDDPSLMAVSKNKTQLETVYRIESPDFSIVDKIICKEKTYKIAEQIGVLAPQTFSPTNFLEAKNYAKALGFPLILKPSVGHLFFSLFKQKMLFINNIEELELAFRKVENYNLTMMMQEYIPGDDTNGINYNSFFINGEPFLEFTAQKVRLTPPKIGFPRVIISKWIHEVINPGRKILKELNYTGFSCIEFKRHCNTGKYILMEVNGRQNLSAPLAVKCGYNFPYITYRYLIDKSLPEITDKFFEGIYWIDGGKDFLDSIRYFKKENYKLSEIIKPYFHKKVFTIANFNDPLPLVYRSLTAIKIASKFFTNKIKSVAN